MLAGCNCFGPAQKRQSCFQSWRACSPIRGSWCSCFRTWKEDHHSNVALGPKVQNHTRNCLALRAAWPHLETLGMEAVSFWRVWCCRHDLWGLRNWLSRILLRYFRWTSSTVKVFPKKSSQLRRNRGGNRWFPRHCFRRVHFLIWRVRSGWL